MKAVVFDRAGEPEDVLRLDHVPPPANIASGDVLLKVSARPIHPADMAFIRGKYRITPKFPQTAGLEGVGTVIEVGSGVNIAVGSRMAFRWHGSWADMAIAPASRLIEAPDDVPDAVACQFSLNPITAWGLLEEGRVTEGDWIVMTAATSIVGNLVGALSRTRGIGVIGLVRGDAADALARCTADHVFSIADPKLPERIKHITGSAGAKCLLDSVGGPGVAALFGSLAPGARIIAYGVMDPAPAPVTNAMLIYANLQWIGFGIDRWLGGRSANQITVMRDQLWSLIRNEVLPLPVASQYPLHDFQQALATYARPQDGSVGKVLLI